MQFELGKTKYKEQLYDIDYKTQQGLFNELFTSAQALESENITLEQKRYLFDAVRQRLEQDIADEAGIELSSSSDAPQAVASRQGGQA